MTGYERIDAGQVYLDEQRITGAPPHARVRARRRPDLPAHPHLPAADRAGKHAGARPSAAGPGGQHRERALELLAFTGIADHAGALAGTLSYGQRKLLELAYVLVADPAVVLLDEPPAASTRR